MVSKKGLKINRKQEESAKKLSNHERFDQFYSQFYSTRWQNLKEALLSENSKYTLEEGLKQPYFLDSASYAAAEALPLSPDDKVLDLCAAPGGKSLVLALKLMGTGELWLSDRSSERVYRLKKVVRDHLSDIDQQNIKVHCRDGSVWGRSHAGYFDRILLDAPCSSERHVIQSPTHMAQWSPARSKNLAIQQFSLLASAFDALKEGGHLLYSTCALSPWENDAVIEKLGVKRKDQFRVLKVNAHEGEETPFGVHVLPDTCGGAGPLYYSLIQKTTNTPESPE